MKPTYRPVTWFKQHRPGLGDLPGMTGATLYQAKTPDGVLSAIRQHTRTGGWHLSVSHPTRLPSWDELVSARTDLTPDHVTLALLLPPEAEYVNLHDFCLHMWEVGTPSAGPAVAGTPCEGDQA